jgi:hypothetical protein
MNGVFPEDLDIGPIDHATPQNTLPPISVVGGVTDGVRSNPWQPDVPEKVGRLKGLSVWLFAAVNGMLLCVFSIRFTQKCLSFLWQLCLDTLFARPW